MDRKLDIVLYEALMEKGLISEEVLKPILEEASLSGQKLDRLLIKRDMVSEGDVLDILSGKLSIPCFDLSRASIDKSVIDKVPMKIAFYYKFVPTKIKNGVLTVAVSSPMDINTQDEIRTHLGYAIDMVFSLEEDVSEALKKYYGLAAGTLEDIVSQTPVADSYSDDMLKDKVEDIEKLAEDASVIKLVNQIILEGWHKRATDIHIEPHREKVFLRYRVDGVLYDANMPPRMKDLLGAIISRIKIMSNLNIVERRLPQDGRAVVRAQKQVIDLRISTIPTPFGESLVIRILPTKMLFSLTKLGLSDPDLEIFKKLIQKPHGVIFLTGPTGSGKTTTLYTCLSSISTRDRKIITIEDPIEYEMPSITQVQVMPLIGLDFAHGLRSILRHDPDVIMVGEVRDLETAEISIRVALTGHLIFSTLHTNDAASGVIRLTDIGVEPYLVASSVEAFIAQRLIRLICPDCKEEVKSPTEGLVGLIAKDLNMSPEDITIFRGKGCSKCNDTGFFGRVAIYEILQVDEVIKDLILKKASSGQITKAALSKGMQTLRQNGWRKVISGMSTPEEVIRVTVEGSDINGPEIAEPLVFSDFGKNIDKQDARHEKRIYSRLDSKVNVRYKIIKSQQEWFKRSISHEQVSLTQDISAGGLLFNVHKPLPIAEMLELKIELPNDTKPIECLAKIVRVEENEEESSYNVAVCFLDITSEDKVKLDKYIRSELKE